MRSCLASSGAQGGEAGGNELSTLGASRPGRAVPGSSKQSVLQAWCLRWRGVCLQEGKVVVETKDVKEVWKVWLWPTVSALRVPGW